MAKQVKSVRMSEDVLDAFASYSDLLQEMFGYSLSLSNVVNEALADFISNSASSWIALMAHSTSVVETLPNGKVKKYEFTEEQIEKMQNIENLAACISASFQSK